MLIASGAGAAPGAAERVILSWKAPEGCPERGDVLAEIGRLLGDRGAPSGDPIQVSAAVSREASGNFVVRIETPGDGATQVRELRGASCKAVAEAAALIIALMIDPSAGTGDAAKSGSATSGSATNSGAASVDAGAPGKDAPTTAGTDGPPNGDPAPPAPAARSTEPAPSRVGTASPRGPAAPPPGASAPPVRPARGAPHATPIALRLAGWAGIDAGSLPAVAAGFGVVGALVYGAQRFEVSASVWPARAGTLVDRPSAGGDVGLFAGGAGTCRDLLDGPIELGPCAAIEIGQLYAEGFGVSAPDRATSVWAAFRGGGALLWAPVARVGLTARVELAIPLLRPRFVLEGVGPVHSPSYVAARGSLGVEVLF